MRRRLSSLVSRALLTASLAGSAAVCTPSAAVAADAGGPLRLSRQSVSTLGVQANGASWPIGVSADGRHVVFHAEAYNLTPHPLREGGSGHQGWFVRDNVAGTTARVDVADWPYTLLSEMVTSGDGDMFALSGRPFGYQVERELLVFDRSAGSLTALAGVAGGMDGNFYPALSPDGTKLACSCRYQGVLGVWIYDLSGGPAVNVTPPRAGASRPFYQAMGLGFSGDGNWLAFGASQAEFEVTNPGEAGGTVAAMRPFVASAQTGLATVVPAAGGAPVDNGSYVYPGGLSRDGNLLAFQSHASNWGPFDANGTSDVYLWNRTTGEITLETVTKAGIQANGDVPAISPDGTRIAFRSSYSRLVNGDSGHSTDLFIKDRRSGTFTSPTVVRDRSDSDYPSAAVWAANSRHFAFSYTGDGLDPLDANGVPDTYLATLPGAASPALQDNAAAASAVTWTMPPGAARIVVRAAEGGYPLSAASGTGLYSGSGTSAPVTSLRAGRAYGVAAFAYTAQGTLLSRRTVTVVPGWNATRTTLRAPTAVRSGSPVTVSAAVTVNGRAMARRPVAVWGRPAGSATWVRVASGVTSASGTYAVTFRPKRSWHYQARHTAEATYTASSSPVATVRVSR